MAGERGPYLTPNRALNLERKIASIEAALRERIDLLERQLAEERRARQAQLRAIALALVAGAKEGEL